MHLSCFLKIKMKEVTSALKVFTHYKAEEGISVSSCVANPFRDLWGFGVQQVMINFFFLPWSNPFAAPSTPTQGFCEVQERPQQLWRSADLTQAGGSLGPADGIQTGLSRGSIQTFSSEAASSQAQQQNSGWLNKSRSPFPDTVCAGMSCGISYKSS